MKTLTVERPWGKFEQFTRDEVTTVKLHSIKPNSSMSLQYHNHRAEFWRVLSGHPILTIGENTVTAKPGDEFTVPKLEKHRIETRKDPAQVLEIAYDNHFDEEDIVRLKDKYGRA